MGVVPDPAVLVLTAGTDKVITGAGPPFVGDAPALSLTMSTELSDTAQLTAAATRNVLPFMVSSVVSLIWRRAVVFGEVTERSL